MPQCTSRGIPCKTLESVWQSLHHFASMFSHPLSAITFNYTVLLQRRHRVFNVLERDYTVKSIIASGNPCPLLRLANGRLYLIEPNITWTVMCSSHGCQFSISIGCYTTWKDRGSCGSQEPTKRPRAADASDLREGEVYCTRSDESQAIVKEDGEMKPDRRNEEHWEQMESLYDKSEETQKPLSLDQYFRQDLDDSEVQERISSLVALRFVYYQHSL